MNPEKPLQVNNHRYFRTERYGHDKFVLVRHDKIHYVEAGKGEPVVLIPGSRSSFRVWNHIMPLLEDQYHLLALDHLAVETKEPAKIEEVIRRQADLIAAMIKQLKLGKVNLIGGRLGGAVAFNVAARYPEVVERVMSVSGLIGCPPAQTKTEKPETKTSKPILNRLEEEAKAIKSPIFYLYGTKTDTSELPLAPVLKFLHDYHPQAWIVALEGGIFEIALQKPQEISSLLLDFLKFKPGLRIG